MLKAQERAGVTGSDNSIVYLVLAIFGFQIVSYAIIQSDINALV